MAGEDLRHPRAADQVSTLGRGLATCGLSLNMPISIFLCVSVCALMAASLCSRVAPGSATVLVRQLVRREHYIAVRWLRCMTLCYSLRALTLGLTSLPGPAQHCRGEYLYRPVEYVHRHHSRCRLCL